ncbi:hypothetical protein [Glycomyces arizonensis]|uniref:hypothetical protein n=1 Tax=Glycomyces arizonensis TaxID=256035 RepID=UPI00041E0458|nr:hypothetical protein [Glycomyces arizonensis]
MHPTHPQQAPALITVRHKPSNSVLFIVFGSVLLALSLALLFADRFSVWIAIGPLFIVAGILSRSAPFMTFDIAQGNLYMHNLFGGRVRKWGAIKSERIVFDGANLVRLRADGTQKKVRTSAGRPEDVQYLQQTVWSLQQRPPA